MRFTVAVAMAGRRLDACLMAAGAAPSAAAARRAIAAGLVRVDGRAEKKGARVRAGQVVEVAEAAAPPAPAAEVPLSVLYEDDDLVVVDKPPGVSSQSLRAGETGTMASALVARYPECARASADPREGGLAHRLDRDTTGVLVAARTPESWRRLREALSGATCEKVYLAEVVGAPSGPEPWIVDVPLGRAGRHGARVIVGGGRQPLEARTQLSVVETRATTSLVEARLSRGRPHQVRAHLAHVGHPVVGDDLYGPAGQVNERLRLHALAVTFAHPRTGERLCVRAPEPPWAKRQDT